MNTRIKALFGVMLDMIAFRDDVTGGHLDRTCKYLELLIGRLFETDLYRDTLRQWDIELVIKSAALHDVGKIAISEELLQKPGKLTRGEFEIIKTHAALGVEILDRIDLPAGKRRLISHARIIAGAHHEKWDGSGYPCGAYGNHIPLEGRLMAIADVYDALISNRPYKQAVSPGEAARVIEDGSGTHFDPQLVEVFRDVAPLFASVASAYAGRHTDAYEVKESYREGALAS
ncbi:MAG: HD domain-containing protein [Clostridiales Family XIII bacterium]|jgi:putative two-component system response regulator|nr:HD domain-containing protein [Clostridiales Family XIII bacterium]